MESIEKKWTHLEDEILKAGVMKYGLNNWAKITSLLNGKTLRDCKKRWLQIEPKNKNFTQNELLKLIECIKTFKNQWNTISSCFINKTAEQCREAYNNLVFNSEIKDRQLNGKCIFAEGIKNEDYDFYEQDEKEKIDFVRARLGNTKSRKSFKRKNIFKNKKE